MKYCRRSNTTTRQHPKYITLLQPKLRFLVSGGFQITAQVQSGLSNYNIISRAVFCVDCNFAHKLCIYAIHTCTLCLIASQNHKIKPSVVNCLHEAMHILCICRLVDLIQTYILSKQVKKRKEIFLFLP